MRIYCTHSYAEACEQQVEWSVNFLQPNHTCLSEERMQIKISSKKEAAHSTL